MLELQTYGEEKEKNKRSFCIVSHGFLTFTNEDYCIRLYFHLPSRNICKKDLDSDSSNL
ncbi:hypothetical protein HanXRQr2_Chr07g0305051 [Helianthus annuus]|uniref:Uncharacterized protein n=1 Tax=Helianthus annuus TaxID=4232 RepID=A0A9K3IMV6_HELAN|nr:hypothetical protein HanXRQr2_Chr07g0305051 [Helianthus annuus]